MKTFLLTLMSLFLITACSSNEDTPLPNPGEQEEMYFPATNSDIWETKTPAELNWNENAIQPLLSYLETKHSKSFIILVNGRIVMENYFNGHTATTPWYWASASKTLTSAVTGIAQQEGLLSIDDKVSDYIGTGWTSAPLEKENLITCRHLLTMTSGLNDEGTDSTTPQDLHYLADAGTRWAYDNVYVKMQDVVAAASGQTWNSYFNNRLRDKTGMTGTWLDSGTEDELSVYWSTTRSMARLDFLPLTTATGTEHRL